MTDQSRSPSPDDARAALSEVERMTDASLRRGLFPRWLVAVISLWCGVLAALFVLGYPYYVADGAVVLIIGEGWYRWKRGARIKDMFNPGILVVYTVIVLLFLFSAVFIGGRVAYDHFGLAWAPYVSGALAAILVFALQELPFRRLRARLARGNRA